MFDGIRNWWNSERNPEETFGPSDNNASVSFVDDGQQTIAVNDVSAFNCSAVWAANSLISESFGATPAHVYRRRKSGTLDKATDHEIEQVFQDIAEQHPAERCISRTPDGAMPPIVFQSAVQSHLGIGGNGYAEIVRNGRGQCTAMHMLQPRCVQVGVNTTGLPYYDVYNMPQLQSDTDVSLYDFKFNGSPERFHFTDMLHVKGFSQDGITGKSPLRCARESIGVSIMQDRYAVQQLVRGRPFGFLKALQRLSPKMLRLIKKNWSERHEGSNNNRQVGILHGGLDWVAAGVNNDDMQFLQLRKFQIAEIARWYRCPPHMLGELSESKYANIEQLMTEFMLTTMLPWFTRWEQEMNLKMFTYSESFNHFVYFDLENWMRGDAETRALVNQIKFRSGVLDIDEWRAEDMKNPLPDGYGSHAMCMASQYDTVERVVQGTSALQGAGAGQPLPEDGKKKPAKDAKK